ncbi:hypothetical protein PC128_g24111 [Phytophthora cactorum]|nr:hypothetical protein PC120_g23464 [Phytophthora cactorum]KAG3042617.1 hypothetical protein PC121_g23072 [Phytophthora cactorum]KAG3145949.1 hypothetical protein PC128_g24111 [Phytophthora cactorum]KAG4041316.1 hypothetical protein PC123_g23166 [Phytophthora cactorum]
MDFKAGEFIWDDPREESVIAQADHRQIKISDADYQKEPLDEHVPDFLNADEQADLLDLLNKFDVKLFSGTTVGNDKEGDHASGRSQDYHQVRKSPWAAPAINITKPNKTVHLLCDSRRLNLQLERHPWPLPKINELFRSIPRFVFVTVLDLNMGYYAIHLTYRSSLLTTFILPFGKYCWLRLLMGISTAPDHFQARIDQLLGNLPFSRCCLDDVLIVTETNFADHLQQVEVVLRRLEDAGRTVSVKKCKLAAKEANYLGYRVATEGISPQPEKGCGNLAYHPADKQEGASALDRTCQLLP